MKKILYTISLLQILIMSSCNDFLNENPQSFVAADMFYSKPEYVRSALNSVYAAAFSDVNSGTHFWLNESTADDASVFINATQGPVPERVAMEQLTYHSELSVLRSAWASSYVTINRANDLLERSKQPETDSVVRSYRAEARFWRAFSYFNLVRWFGDVPLLTETVRPDKDNFYPKREAASLVYNQIIEDLRFAAKYCPKKKYNFNDKENGGRVTQAGAMTYLAKVYLTMAGYPMNNTAYLTNALDTMKQVLDNRSAYGYDFMPVYADIFDFKKYEINTELMVYIQGAGNEYLKTNMHGFFYNYNGMLHPSREVAEGTKVFSFDENTPDTVPMRQDLRRATAFKVLGLLNGVSTFLEPDASVVGNFITIGKWLDYEQRDYPRNAFGMLRFSEAVLLYDELVCMLQDGSKRTEVVEHLKNFRVRGGFYDPIKVKNESWDDLMAEVKLERRRDLLFESHRRNDLIRWGVYIQTKKKSLANQFNTLDNVWDYIKDDHLCLFPIPLYEFNTNGLLGEQNPGYGGK